MLKGDAPATVSLEVEVGAQVAPGTLVALFIDPVQTTSPCPTPTLRAGQEGVAPTPAPAPTVAGTGGAAAPLFLYQGECAAVVPLPAGADAAGVTLQ